MGTRDRDDTTSGIEHELTLHLERASDLSQRAKRANDAAQHEIERAREIADQLRGVSSEFEARAERLRRSSGRR
jgi:DNA anti-recombination protein RmuC